MAGKSAVLAVRIIGDATGATKALRDTESALDKLTPAAAVAGGASAAALTAGFFDAVSVEAGLSKVQGQLGLTEAEAERVGIVSAELFANGWGTGADQINEALSSVVGNIDGMRAATDEQLTSVSEKVLTVANTFDQDLGGITTAVGQLMRTGMAPDAEAALDIITTGLQTNTRAGEDLLDTFTEYPALFERLGIDGQTATGLIAQGLDAGARSTDLVADALKEFQIRATDGTEASAAGFQALGLDAAEMTAQIAAGGEGAKAGLDQVLDGLRSMTDPVAQNAAAVALFGTQAEDLGGALYALDPSSATAALGEVTGAASTLSETMGDNTQTKLTEFTRLVQTSFQEVAAQAIPVIQPVLEAMKEFAPILGPLALVIGAVSGAILIINGAMKAYAAAQAIATAAQWASNAAWLASPITWIILAVIAVIALLVVAIVWVVENWEVVAAVAAHVWESIIAWIQTAIEWVQNKIAAAILVGAYVWNQIKDTATAVFQTVINWIQQAISWVSDGISGAINGVLGWFTGFRDTVVGVFQTVIDWVKNAISWIGDLASNAVPGWAKDLLGMSSRSFSMPVTPEAMPFTIPRYAARMSVTPDVAAFAGTDSALSVSAFSAPSLLSIPRAAPSLSRSAPQQAVYEDHSEHHYHFPNYLGDKEEIVEELDKAMQKRKRRNEGLVLV